MNALHWHRLSALLFEAARVENSKIMDETNKLQLSYGHASNASLFFGLAVVAKAMGENRDEIDPY